jgi:hypothetical protein
MRDVVLTVATGFGPFFVMQLTRDLVVGAATASEASRAFTRTRSVKCIVI